MPLTKTLRGLLRARPRTSSICPDAQLRRLQDHLSESCGGAVIGCRKCEPEGFIVPIVNLRPSGYEIAALACAKCHEIYPLDEPGQLAFCACGEEPASTALH